MFEKITQENPGSVLDITTILIELGIRRQVALTLTYIYKNSNTTSRSIETGTKLRQPEVSIAIQWLRRKGWIKKDVLKRKIKGRPVHVYDLAIPFSEIIARIEEEEQRQTERRRQLLQKLKEMNNNAKNRTSNSSGTSSSPSASPAGTSINSDEAVVSGEDSKSAPASTSDSDGSTGSGKSGAIRDTGTGHD